MWPRHLPLLAVVLSLFACSKPVAPDDGLAPRDDAGTDAGTDGGTLPSTLTLNIPEVTIPAAADTHTCFHTTLDAGRAAGVKRWVSSGTAAIAELTVYLLDTPTQPEGTMEANCGEPPISAKWVYSAPLSPWDLTLPASVGMTLAPGQAAMVRLHYVNVGPADVVAKATIQAELHPEGTLYQEAGAFIAEAISISISPMANGSTTQSCAVPSTASFFALHARTRKYGLSAKVRDGAWDPLESTCRHASLSIL